MKGTKAMVSFKNLNNNVEFLHYPFAIKLFESLTIICTIAYDLNVFTNFGLLLEYTRLHAR